ncbi:hypothetical protein A9404_06795 [Halothiobacillus diazotrophicus]|uniref:DUF4124 domain-containing protein n=1 Tax=Halothiobacillus diazotrophicus TaxID=1860122 RepID=A0A191ZGW7_9GAMM|nr:DUF4124 domain-containing protein [Halothiobacillus diazotrophicus]ANJ67131.1 hypothetical protein A9404_06795 [Halothiobacillus diazotrophicus]
MQRLGKNALITLLALSNLALAGVSHADDATRIYKWVDKKGETHFSQLPPSSGHVQAEQINPDYAAPPSAPADETDTSKNPPSGATEPKGSKLPADTPITVFNKKEAEKACQAAEAQIKVLKSPENQLMTRDTDGKFRPLSPGEIADRLKQAQGVANKACVE